MKAFKAPKDTLGDLTAETAANLVAAAADIALVIDGDGVIQDVAFGQTDLSLELERYGSWFGRPWSETVTAESQTEGRCAAARGRDQTRFGLAPDPPSGVRAATISRFCIPPFRSATTIDSWRWAAICARSRSCSRR